MILLLVACAFDTISRMHSSVVSLPNDPLQLQAEVVQLRNAVEEKEQALTEKTQRIEQLLDYILLLRKRQFGASADRANKDQVSLFDEAELEQLDRQAGQDYLPMDVYVDTRTVKQHFQDSPIRARWTRVHPDDRRQRH